MTPYLLVTTCGRRFIVQAACRATARVAVNLPVESVRRVGR